MLLETFTHAGIDISAELAELTSRARASVVEIRSGQGAGSGVIWSPAGLIVTNHHVVADESASIVLADGHRLTGRVLRRDPGHDLALVQVDAQALPAATIGDSRQLRIGQLVLAIGNPLGVPRAVSVGMISGPPAGRHGRLEWRDALLVEIELRPGNSGGPLLDSQGHVIGINSMVIGPRTALSIPSHTVRALVAGEAAADLV